tara:strand:+ start:920 stop:3262 length:2343 start_codon:yes stop_codon:yes gene_type:complete
MSKTTHVVEVRTQVTGDKQVNKLTKDITKTGVAGKTAGIGIGASFKAATASIASAIPALRGFTVALASTGIGAIVIALGSLAGLFTSAGRKGAEFEKAISGLGAVSGASAEEIGELSDQAKLLGSTTAFTASQVVRLQTELAKLGFTVIDIQNATPAILDLAASLDVSLAEAATFAGSTVRAFGLSTEDTLDVVNVLAQSTTKSALNFSLLQESLKLLAPTAKAVGLTLRDTTTLLGVLADNGIKGSRAGTGLSRALTELNAKGLTLNDAYVKINSSANKLVTATELVGTVGGRALLTLAANTPAIETLSIALDDVAGAANNIANTRLDNLAGDMTKLGSAWEGFLLNIEDGTGTINALSRGAIQLLTASIAGVQDAFQIAGFYLRDFVQDIQQRGINGINFLIQGFDKLQSSVKLFVNVAKLQLAEVPIIGKAIDKDVVEKNIADATKALIRAEENLDRIRDAGDIRRKDRATRFLRFLAFKQKEEQELKKAAALKDVEDEALLTDPETGETEEAKKARLLKEAFFKKLKKDEEDQTATTALLKNDLEKERHLAELDKLGLEHTQKKEVIARIDKLYADKAKSIQDEIDKTTLANGEEVRKKRVAGHLAAAEAVISSMGAESAAGKAALIIRNGILLQEMAMEAKAALTKIALDNAKSGVSVAAGFIETLKAGFPKNVPLLVLYAAQAATLVSSMLKSTNQAKAAIGGGGGIGASIETPASPTESAPPDFNVVGASATNQLGGIISSQANTPIKTFVVASDVTTGQALERNIIDGATLG